MNTAIEFKNLGPALWGLIGFSIWLLTISSYFAVPWFRKKSKTLKNKFLNILSFITFALGVIAWLLIAFGFSGPRIPLLKASKDLVNNDIFIILDTSRSMLANDFYPNRLELAKKEIKDFVLFNPSNRISLITFSEKYFTLVPLTYDRDYFVSELNKISAMELGPGTNIGDSLGLTVYKAERSLARNKTIILLTDGVSQIESIDPLVVAEKAAAVSVPIYTIGIGADKNAKIPMKDQSGQVQYLSEIPGSSYDMKLLENISKITKAKFYQAKDQDSLKRIFIEIEKKESDLHPIYKDWTYMDMTYYFLALGLSLFLCVELLRILLFKESMI